VCAAGLVGSTADDVAKEVAIYRAHKAAPVVIASEGETRFSAALDLITVPNIHPRLAFVLSTVAGHLFGYEAARAIDAQARPLREMRAAIERASAEGNIESAEALLAGLQPLFQRAAGQFFDGLRASAYNGHLDASTAVRLTSVLRYALALIPLDSYQLELGKIGTPSVVLEDLAQALAFAIDELTRPIDAIKHQAKTVTVEFRGPMKPCCSRCWSRPCSTPARRVNDSRTARCARSGPSTRRSMRCSATPVTRSRTSTTTRPRRGRSSSTAAVSLSAFARVSSAIRD